MLAIKKQYGIDLLGSMTKQKLTQTLLTYNHVKF